MSLAVLTTGGLLLLAIVWDVFVISRYGLSSGLTASWLAYVDSKRYPILAVTLGLLSGWLLIDQHVNLIVAIWFYVLGHLTFVMRGA